MKKMYILASWLLCAPFVIAGSDSVTGGLDARDYSITVVSAHGTPDPVAGTTSNYCWKSAVTCTVDSVVHESGSYWLCSGWTGTGSLPATGSTNTTGAMVLTNQHSSLTWRWEQMQGAIRCVINPEGVRALARWRVGGGDWQTSGSLVDGLTPGQYDVEFSNVAGWKAPGATNATVSNGQTVATSVTYEARPSVIGAIMILLNTP